jgi:hypothetical protein
MFEHPVGPIQYSVIDRDVFSVAKEDAGFATRQIMRNWLSTLVVGIIFAGVAVAQQAGAPPQPPLADCGTHNGIDSLCGTRSPEDLELTPDRRFLIVSQFVNSRGGTEAGLVLFDLAKKTYEKIPITVEPRKDWGDPACPGPVGDGLVPHGISLLKRSGGAIQLFVVNHGGRQSIEMFELHRAAGAWDLVWHGCVVAAKEYNDVAALPDGGFIATHPTALREPGDNSNIFGGQATGYVARWSAGMGETELPGTRVGYPNGVVVSEDGRFMYLNAWTVREVHKYDIKAAKDVGVVKLDFMPDNLTWTKNRRLLAAGVKGARGECPAGSGTPCIQQFGVAEIDPATMSLHSVFDSEGKGALISGVSVALQVNGAIYIGAFQGDRLVRVTAK